MTRHGPLEQDGPGGSSVWARLQPWLSTLARFGLGLVFVLAGALKVVDPAASVRAVTAYEILPIGPATLVGYALPFAEIVLGLVLWSGLMTRAAAVLGAALLVIFMVGVASAWARGLSIDCGCFGGGGPVAPGQTQYVTELLRDTGFAMLAAWLIVWPGSRLGLGHTHGDDHDLVVAEHGGPERGEG